MRIGIIGGTGGMGEGFALRWCFKHDVVVGSRDAKKAEDAAEKYLKMAREVYGHSMTGTIIGDGNIALAKESDLLILSIPYEHINEMCTSIIDQVGSGCIIVSPIVPMSRTESGFAFTPMEQGTKPAACMVADKLPPRDRVVSAFHTISEVKLRNVKESLDADTFVCGDDLNTVATLNNLVSEISGLRSIYLGPLSLTYQAEILTPMLLNAAKRNKMKNLGIRLV